MKLLNFKILILAMLMERQAKRPQSSNIAM